MSYVIESGIAVLVKAMYEPHGGRKLRVRKATT